MSFHAIFSRGVGVQLLFDVSMSTDGAVKGSFDVSISRRFRKQGGSPPRSPRNHPARVSCNHQPGGKTFSAKGVAGNG